MSGPSVFAPAGAHPIAGIVNTRSPCGVSKTVSILTDEIAAAGATMFAVVDHSGEAARAAVAVRAQAQRGIGGNVRVGEYRRWLIILSPHVLDRRGERADVPPVWVGARLAPKADRRQPPPETVTDRDPSAIALYSFPG